MQPSNSASTYQTEEDRQYTEQKCAGCTWNNDS